MKIIRSPSFKQVYANFLRMRINASDFSIIHGVVDQDPNGENYSTEDGAIVMVPASAKLLSVGLAAAIEQYEKSFGTIQIPSDLKMDKDAISSAMEVAAGRKLDV